MKTDKAGKKSEQAREQVSEQANKQKFSRDHGMLQSEKHFQNFDVCHCYGNINYPPGLKYGLPR